MTVSGSPSASLRRKGWIFHAKPSPNRPIQSKPLRRWEFADPSRTPRLPAVKTGGLISPISARGVWYSLLDYVILCHHHFNLDVCFLVKFPNLKDRFVVFFFWILAVRPKLRRISSPWPSLPAGDGSMISLKYRPFVRKNRYHHIISIYHKSNEGRLCGNALELLGAPCLIIVIAGLWQSGHLKQLKPGVSLAHRSKAKWDMGKWMEDLGNESRKTQKG